MGQIILFSVAAVVLGIRDARLLGGRLRLWLPYVLLTLGISAMSGFVAERLSDDDVAAWMDDRRLWVPAMLVHAALALVTARRNRSGGEPNLIAVLPTPVWFVSVTGWGRMVLARVDGASGLWTGLALGTAYLLSVGLAAWVARPSSRSREALRFATAAHLTSVLLVPGLASLDRSVSAQPVNWVATVAVLGTVLILLALSFAWHRMRSR